MSALGLLLLIGFGLVIGILLIIFVLVPLLKGVGWLIGSIFRGIGWLVIHIFEFIGGMISDAIRFIGAIIAFVLLLPFVPLNIIVGRWSAAGHFAESVKRECKVGILCIYRILLQRPLKLFMLHGLLEGLEQRVPEAMAASPGSDKPSRRTGQFDGYTIVGSLPGGGSGAKLYIAKPDEAQRDKHPEIPDQVVIKSFALADGSSLPQIVRESRALEAAKQLGLVFEHGMDDRRFYYVMPFHAGDHLGIVTRQLHGETAGRGLQSKQLAQAMQYIIDLVQTLCAYHEGGLWHKDVKPENIIIHDGHAHVVDLGLVTPLQSAMTLTTHGTEYFRDPEMVRQALRGVKVHQVDGAKFDIYAAGAVLYFMTENTFPAHGGLSRFTKKSPEALRWVVRRSMAEYNQRYSSADDMLNDLIWIAQSVDPYSIKPAQLPSMQGDVAPANYPEPEMPEPVKVVSARSPATPVAAAMAAAAEAVAAAEQAAEAAVEETQRAVDPSVTPTPPRRPKLRVTNWWTGAYKVDDPGSSDEDSAFSPEAVKFREQAKAARKAAGSLRHQAGQYRQQVHAGVITARKAAREQVKAARQRARELRKNAHHRRHAHKHNIHTRSSTALLVIGFITVVSVISLAFLASRTISPPHHISVASIPLPDFPSLPAGASITLGDDSSSPPLLVYVEASDKKRENPAFQKKLSRHINEYIKDSNYTIVIDKGKASEEIDPLFNLWLESNGDYWVDTKLEDALEQYNLYGILHITESKGGFDSNVIWSEREGAKYRTFIPELENVPQLPYLLINDHPAKSDPLVEKKIESLVQKYRDRGWEIVESEEAEMEVRRVLPAGPVDSETDLPVLFGKVLGEFEYGGVLRIEATQDEGELHERVRAVVITSPTPPHTPDSPESTSTPEEE